MWDGAGRFPGRLGRNAQFVYGYAATSRTAASRGEQIPSSMLFALKHSALMGLSPKMRAR